MVRKIGQFLLMLAFLLVLQVKGLKAEEIPKVCQVICPGPDGNSSYYITAPEVTVKHMDENLVTRYQLSLPGGRKVIGKLEGTKKGEVLSAEMFAEGSHKLDTWLEDVKGQVISGTEQSRQFKIDRNAPILTIQLATGTEASLIEVKAEDAVSGVAGIYYTVSGSGEQYITGNHGYVSVSEEFQGPLRAYAVDYAGNKSQVYEIEKEDISIGKTVRNNTEARNTGEGDWLVKDKQNQTRGNEQNNKKEVEEDSAQENLLPKLVIEGFENYSIVGKNLEYVCRIYEAGNIQNVKGEIVWENKKGKSQITELKGWKEVEGQYVYYGKLTVDGIYHISVEVIDSEGGKYQESRQVIIDKTDPVIQSIAELDGAQLTCFQWGNDIDGMVNDFTTYTYEVRLDGVLCDTDKVYTKPGKHILEVLVTDAAGNESRATATFYIVNEIAESTGSVLRWIWPCTLLFGISLVGFVWVFKGKNPIKREEAR